MRGRNTEDRGRRSEVRGLAVGSAGERGGKMAPGAGRVEPNQRKRAGIRLRQAASAKATASQGRAGSVIQSAEDGGRKARSKEAQASGEGVGTLKLARGA